MKTLIDNEYGHLKYEWWEGYPLFHLELYKWSKSLYKSYLQVFDYVLAKFKDNGVTQVFVAIPDNDQKLLKFEKMFGFEVDQHAHNVYILKKVL